ncbi:MAG: hypothetical protein PVG07_02805 [Acidobacteriota bacterium]|jgi:hypothetical protein
MFRSPSKGTPNPVRCILAAGLALLVATVAAGPAAAQPRAGDCVIGPGLAATLLVPYFEVELGTFTGKTTLVSVNNGLSSPTLARVVLWTDWAVPTVAFDVYLRGFDVQTINLRDVFNGSIPSTGAGADLSGYPFCSSLTPVHANPALSPNQVAQIRGFHTGTNGPMDPRCAGEYYGDGIARGYLTVDVVDECSGVEAVAPIFTPANTTYPYFVDGGGSSGIAVTDNQLWGDVLYVDASRNFAQGMEVVGLWADPALFSGTNIFTFYGRYSGWDGRDDRVPLPYRWDQRFLNGGAFAGGANMIVWRDTESSAASPLPCAAEPSWKPLMATCGCMDEQAGNYHGLPQTTFPLATQRVDVAAMGVPYPFGWMQIDGATSQVWVQSTLTAEGRYSATLNGTPVEFLCNRTP